MGGDNDHHNIVSLTGREHFIVHKLLMKLCEKYSNTKIYGKSVYSVMCFTMKHLHEGRRQLTSRDVDELRIRMSSLRKNIKTGRKPIVTEESRKKMSENHWLRNGGTHPLKGVGHKTQSKKKMSISMTRQWYRAISPKGEIYDKVSLPVMSREHNLNIDCLYRFAPKGKPIPPVPDRVKSQTNQNRHNSTGWLFIPIDPT